MSASPPKAPIAKVQFAPAVSPVYHEIYGDFG